VDWVRDIELATLFCQSFNPQTTLEWCRSLCTTDDDMFQERFYVFDIPMERLRNKGVEIIRSTKVKEIGENSVTMETDGQEVTLKGADLIVLALGSKSVDTLSEQIKGKVAEIYVIGDAKKPRKAREAIEEGRLVGRML
jgi:hypothetical protein